METDLQIKNQQGEKLDTLVEGNEKANVTIIFVHGFATDKHETACYFDDLAGALKNNFRIVRFDLSGCGKSEGKTEDVNYAKHAQDLETIIGFTRKNYPGKIYILAQSMGCFVTALLAPDGIEKTIFTGIPNSDTKYIVERLKKRFGSRPGAKIDLQGVSLFPRSTGALQKIGASFWQVLLNLNPIEKVKSYAKKTKLVIFHPLQDEVVGPDYQKEYDNIAGVATYWINGDHSFKKKEDRHELIKLIAEFFYSPL